MYMFSHEEEEGENSDQRRGGRLGLAGGVRPPSGAIRNNGVRTPGLAHRVTSIVNRPVVDGNGNSRGRCRLGLSGSRRGPNPVTRWTALGTTEGNLSFSTVHHSYMKYASSSLRVLLIICSSCVLMIICCSRVLLSIAVVHHAYLHEILFLILLRCSSNFNFGAVYPGYFNFGAVYPGDFNFCVLHHV
jgi:hypothetical protein